jgi:hypothetical protein
MPYRVVNAGGICLAGGDGCGELRRSFCDSASFGAEFCSGASAGCVFAAVVTCAAGWAPESISHGAASQATNPTIPQATSITLSIRIAVLRR